MKASMPDDFSLAWRGRLSTNYQYLIRLLQEEAAQSNAEVENIRNSLRYRVGGLLVEAFPPSLRSFTAIRGLLRLFIQQTRSGRSSAAVSTSVVSETTLMANTFVFAASASVVDRLQAGVWATTDAAQLAAAMDYVRHPGTLVLQQLDQAVLRRLGRWQALGGLIEWQPLPGEQYAPALLGYLQALVDIPIESCA